VKSERKDKKVNYYKTIMSWWLPTSWSERTGDYTRNSKYKITRSDDGFTVSTTARPKFRYYHLGPCLTFGSERAVYGIGPTRRETVVNCREKIRKL